MDYSGLVAKMKAQNVDCVIPTASAQWTVPLLKEIERQAWDVKVIVTQACATPSLLNKLVGSAAEGVYITMINQPLDSDDPFMNKYRETTKKYGGDKGPNQYEFLSYGVTRLFETALIQCGRDLTRENLINTVESWKDFDTGWLGKISYSPTDHVGQEGMLIVRMKGGKAEIIGPRYYPDPRP